MTITRERCSECGTMHVVCPDCSGTRVTPYDPTDISMPLSMGVQQFVDAADRGDEATFEHTCWDCGWTEQWTVSIS